MKLTGFVLLLQAGGVMGNAAGGAASSGEAAW